MGSEVLLLLLRTGLTGKKGFPEVSSSLKSLEISSLQRRVPVSESRDELCPP